MPKNKFQEVIFTIIMVFVMVYAMICYNIVLNTGTMTNETFLLAFHELTFMGPIAFILDFFIIGGLAKKIAFGIVDMRRDNPFHLVLAAQAIRRFWWYSLSCSQRQIQCDCCSAS